MTGQDVVCLQEAINRDRASDIAVDGIYGPATADAVGGFQNAVGLPPTGVAEPTTLQRYGIWSGAARRGGSDTDPLGERRWVAGQLWIWASNRLLAGSTANLGG